MSRRRPGRYPLVAVSVPTIPLALWYLQKNG